MNRFSLVATGGTFDCIHQGHLNLLSESFRIGQKVIIGLTSDQFVRKYKVNIDIKHDYTERLENLNKVISINFPNRDYDVVRLDDEFGPILTSNEIEAIVVSEDTFEKISQVNKIRSLKNFKPLKISVIRMVNSRDGKPLSSTRIRNGEIDEYGNILCD
ncbi:MAG: pantetheine-phosphate adenylyltransferase [Nitrososphaeraceae archaeon]|nr:pantetheine-phosphate adenylyltransferase [Nitrososphaeraceae archaeon]